MNQPNPQLAFGLHDEDRALAILKDDCCPVCNWPATLFRRMVNGKPRFFVRCWYNRRDMAPEQAPFRCSQPPVLTDGAASSLEAVQAWRLVCMLARS